jgi:hypothetical protein
MQAEFYTTYATSDLGDLKSICLNTQPGNLKYFKILRYEKYRGYAQIICVYDKAEDNVLLTLNKTRQWEVITGKKLNQDRSFYWPIYS